jgi:GTP-binding protein HSR1-related protein
MGKNIFKEIERSIMNEQMEDKTREKLLVNLLKMKNQKINLMVTGATGVGKSSTINALFGEEVAKVGTSVDPETMEIDKYELDNLIIWDTPGLGDGKEADNRHSKRIIDKLYEKDENGDLLIDLVLVILDGSSRDLGTSYELINSVIIPNLGENKKNRILVAINQADVAMKGKYWNVQENKPEEKLQEFLEDKVKSVKRRIKEATGIEIEPIYYSAGEKEEGYMQQKPYNLAKLLYYILQCTPEEKRLVYAQNMNREEVMWKDNDDLQDYRKDILGEFLGSVTKGIAIGGAIGEALGSLVGLGQVGRVIGSVGGAIVGAASNIIGGVVDFFDGIF